MHPRAMVSRRVPRCSSPYYALLQLLGSHSEYIQFTKTRRTQFPVFVPEPAAGCQVRRPDFLKGRVSVWLDI
ncbi:hypothetical protein BD309DRAFT_969929 [Dichomitus squalens]|nr:hypothetical protein BD309DRAFT_969929 [Dichomitus squalens]